MSKTIGIVTLTVIMAASMFSLIGCCCFPAKCGDKADKTSATAASKSETGHSIGANASIGIDHK